MNRRLGAAPASLAPASTVVADTAASAAAAPLTDSQFKKQANAICKGGDKETEAIFETAFPNQQSEPDPSAIAAVVPQVLESISSQIAAVGALEPSKKLQPKVSAFLEQAKADVGAVAANPTSFDEKSFVKTKKLARKIPIKCAQ